MRRSERDEWVADLRSELFPQFTGGLLRAGEDYSGAPRDSFCCLGVKLERDARTGRHGIVRVDEGYAREGSTYATDPGDVFDIVDTMPSAAMLSAWGLSEGAARELASMNDGETDDGRSYSFDEIADWIEANVPVDEDATVDA